MNVYIIGNSMSKVQAEELAMLCDMFDHKVNMYYAPNRLNDEFGHLDNADVVVVFEVTPETGILAGYARARSCTIIAATDAAIFIPDAMRHKSVAAIFAKIVGK